MNYRQFMDLWNGGKKPEGYFDGVEPRLKELREKLLIQGIGESGITAMRDLTDEVQVLAFSEPWCPDCVINLTVLEMLAEHSPRMTVHILGREGHEALITSLNTEGKAYIPTFLVFVNEKYAGVFVEQPELLKQHIAEGTQADRIVCMQNYRNGMYADAVVEELLAMISERS